jgi:hypothetical protein
MTSPGKYDTYFRQKQPTTLISIALGAWPTVSGRFLDFLCGETHCYSYFRHKQVKKNGHFPHQEVLKVNERFV